MAKMDKFSEKELRNIVSDCCSFRELARRLGYSAVGNNFKTIKNRLKALDISTNHFTGRPKNCIKRSESNIFCVDSTVSQRILRSWYLKGKYSDYKCSICGLPPLWNNKELVLTLDHINGINNDNRLENLRWVCPNCDRQLSTFAGKNLNNSNKELKYHCCKTCGKIISNGATYCRQCYSIKRRVVVRPNKEQIEADIKSNSIESVGRKYGVSGNTIRKWCKSFGILIDKSRKV